MVRIVTDSTSDITQEEGAALNITIVPLTVHFGNESFVDGINLTKADFFEKLACADKLPTTSQVPPGEFSPIFHRFVEAGDEVVGIFISSELSGTYQSALAAREKDVQDKIYVIDSRSAAYSLALLVREAIRLRDAGKSAKEIDAAVRALVKRVRLMAVVDTLKYLRMGGRISNTTAFVGGLLGINPIISVTKGKVESIGKARGMKAGLKFIGDQLVSDPPDLNYLFAFGHTSAPKALREAVDYFTNIHGVVNYFEADIGITVGTHIGPGAVGIAYIAKE